MVRTRRRPVRGPWRGEPPGALARGGSRSRPGPGQRDERGRKSREERARPGLAGRGRASPTEGGVRAFRPGPCVRPMNPPQYAQAAMCLRGGAGTAARPCRGAAAAGIRPPRRRLGTAVRRTNAQGRKRQSSRLRLGARGLDCLTSEAGELPAPMARLPEEAAGGSPPGGRRAPIELEESLGDPHRAFRDQERRAPRRGHRVRPALEAFYDLFFTLMADVVGDNLAAGPAVSHPGD